MLHVKRWEREGWKWLAIKCIEVSYNTMGEK